jgi:hypothetical protein
MLQKFFVTHVTFITFSIHSSKYTHIRLLTDCYARPAKRGSSQSDCAMYFSEHIENVRKVF